MCLHQKRSCTCGGNEAYLFHRDDILPEKLKKVGWRKALR